MVTNPLTILHVEDDNNDADLFALAVRRARVDILLRRVSNGYAGIDYLLGRGEHSDRARFPLPDLFVLDSNMPGLSGIQFIEWCSACAICRELHVVMLMGGTPGDREIQRCLERGAARVYLKPSGLNELCGTVREIYEYGAGVRAKRSLTKPEV